MESMDQSESPLSDTELMPRNKRNKISPDETLPRLNSYSTTNLVELNSPKLSNNHDIVLETAISIEALENANSNEQTHEAMDLLLTRDMKTMVDGWSTQEHRLFLMGIMKYGRGRWMQIAEELVQTKDPKQVEEHAELVFKSFQLSTSETVGDTTSTDIMTQQQYQHQNPMFTTHPSADSSVRQVMFVPPSPALAPALPRPTMIMYPIAASHNPDIWQAAIVSNAPSSSAPNTDITNKMMIQQGYQVPPPPPPASPQPNDGPGIDLELRLGRVEGEMDDGEEPLMYRWL